MIVEDELDIARLIEYNLKKEGYRTVAVHDGSFAALTAAKEKPSLILLDLMLPGLDGLDVCRRLKADAKTSAIPIIMLTAKGEESDKVLGLGLGADDYVTKPFSVKELLARVQAVLRRCAPEFVKGTLRVGPIELDTVAYEARVDGRRITLTPTEFRLLRFLMASPGRVYTRQQLLDNVWGDHVYIEDRTVDIHIRRLRVALGARAEQMVETVRGAGYKLIASSELHPSER